MAEFDLGLIVGRDGEDGKTPVIKAGDVKMVASEGEARIETIENGDERIFNFFLPRPAFPDNMGDMKKSVYDSENKGEDIYLYTDKKIESIGYITEFSCQKVENTFLLTNNSLPSTLMVNGIFKAPDNYNEGDTFSVNGINYEIVTANGETLEKNHFIKNVIVSVVIDRESGTINFKNAGSGASLPAESVLLECFTEDGTFVVPKTGTYRITCIGKGGDGLGAVVYDNYELCGWSGADIMGSGGGAGGAGEITVKLKKDEEIKVKTSNVASFGNWISSTPGGTGESHNPTTYEEICVTVGKKGECNIIFDDRVIKGIVFENEDGNLPSDPTCEPNEFKEHAGSGGAYKEGQSKFLSVVGGEGGRLYGDGKRYKPSGSSSTTPSPFGLAPFGTGGGGGSVDGSTLGDAAECYPGGKGASAAVIVEYLAEYSSTDGGNDDEVVKAKPEIILNYNGTVDINKGESISLYANITSKNGNVFEYSWFKDGKQLQNYYNSDFALQPHITLFDVTEQSSGKYTVVVTDGVATASKSVYLNVTEGLTNFALNKEYTYFEEPNETYSDGGNDLTNGKITQYRYFLGTGSEDYVGFTSKQNAEVTVDLEKDRKIERILTSMLSTEEAGTQFVDSVDFYVASEGGEFEKFGTWTYPGPLEADKSLMGILIARCEGSVTGRYIKVHYNKKKDDNDKPLGWTFISEIQAFGKDGEQ